MKIVRLSVEVFFGNNFPDGLLLSNGSQISIQITSIILQC